MRARCKPREIVVGRAYRLYRPFSLKPSDQVLLVTKITQMTRTSRNVDGVFLKTGEGRGWPWNYTELMARIHSEERLALQ